MAWRTRRPEDRERGSMHVMTIPIAIAMLTAAVLVITMVGSATDGRRQAGTAADAAALAAAQEWDEHFGLLHAVRLRVPEPASFWGLAEEALISPALKREMVDAAEAFAERNGAELVRLDIDTARLRVTAEVRHDRTVPHTEARATASATAGITLRGGLCVGDDGLGWLIDGRCETGPDEEDTDDTGGEDSDDGSDDGTEGDDEPAWTPPDVADYSSRVVLLR